MICHIVYQKLNHTDNTDATFSGFKKELPSFFEGAGQPNKQRAC